MELKKIKDLVFETLKQGEVFRENDDKLYLAICVKVFSYNDRCLTTMTVGEFFTNRKRLGLPSFESVRRSRQKVMEEHPELKPCEKVLEARKKQEEKFYKFATVQGELF